MNKRLTPSQLGKARAAALTPERRSEIARKAAETRWKNNACDKPQDVQ